MSVLGSNVWVVRMSGLVNNKFSCGFQLVNWSSFGKLATLWSSVESVDPPVAAAPNLTTEPSVLVSQVAATGGSRELVGNKGWWWPWPWGG